MAANPTARPADRPEVLLEACDLCAGYGDAAVVQGLDVQIHAGEIVALLGPNGAGKTTTILTLAGELRPLRGSVLWLGAPMNSPTFKLARQGLMLVPEERSVVMSMSVADNLLLGSGGVEAATDVFPELSPLLRRRAGLLSGGEQQMLTLARALATAPRVLLIDELSLGLAPIMVDRLLRRLTDFAKERSVGVLLVEQHARRATKLADRWLVMRNGRIVREGEGAVGADELQRSYFADDPTRRRGDPFDR